MARQANKSGEHHIVQPLWTMILFVCLSVCVCFALSYFVSSSKGTKHKNINESNAPITRIRKNIF